MDVGELFAETRFGGDTQALLLQPFTKGRDKLRQMSRGADLFIILAIQTHLARLTEFLLRGPIFLVGNVFNISCGTILPCKEISVAR